MKKRWICLLPLLLCAVVLCLPSFAAGTDPEAGNVTLSEYYVDGVRVGYYVSSCPETVTQAVVPAAHNGLPVLHIGEDAFRGHHNLTSIYLPDTIQTIGSCAFFDCYQLSSITLPASAVFQKENPSNYACRDAKSLFVHLTAGSGTMPDFTGNYTWTPWYSASWYNIPVTVVIDDGVKNIGASAFRACDDLISLTVGKDVAAVGDEAFHGCSSLPAADFLPQADSIGAAAFMDCAALPSATVKEGVTELKENTFRGCHSLTKLVLPNSLASIGNSALFDCYALSDLTMPASAVFQKENPSNYACRDSESLSVHLTPGSGTMPDFTSNYTWTPWYSAARYDKPVTVVIDDGVKNIGASAFRACDDLISLTAGKNVAAVGDEAFHGCSRLPAADFLPQADSVGAAAFMDCAALAAATIKEGVTELKENTFRGCHSLTKLVLPNSLASIGNSALFDCYTLSDLTMPASAVFQKENPSNYACRDSDSLSVHLTPGSGTMPDFTSSYTWTPWYSAAWYNKPVSIVIDEGVENLGISAFRSCDDLTALTLPSTLTLVESYATYECTKLYNTNVFYGGTTESWSGITIQDHNALENTTKPVLIKATPVTVRDSSGQVLSSASYYDIEGYTVFCALYSGRGRLAGLDFHSPGETLDFSFGTEAEQGAYLRLLFVKEGYIPVRAPEILTLSGKQAR